MGVARIAALASPPTLRFGPAVARGRSAPIRRGLRRGADRALPPGARAPRRRQATAGARRLDGAFHVRAARRRRSQPGALELERGDESEPVRIAEIEIERYVRII